MEIIALPMPRMSLAFAGASVPVGKWPSSKCFISIFPATTSEATSWISKCQGWLINHAGLTRGLYKSFSKHKTDREILNRVN